VIIATAAASVAAAIVQETDLVKTVPTERFFYCRFIACDRLKTENPFSKERVQ
jgi:hypothetical protein